ncbi:MAG: ABC transporter substrate-binding protein [Clostridia bacterium]|nr:ABC transporter substrate-binding protein [Clostridia bacterium]
MKRIISFVIIVAIALTVLASCAQSAPSETTASTAATTAAEEQTKPDFSGVKARTFALKGPTGMGIAKLMNDAENGKAALDYEFTIVASPTEITPEILAGRFEIAAVPVNLAATLYNKGADISVVAVNTLGVLYTIEKGNTVNSIYDLKGKTIYATGKGSTPEYIIDYLLENAGIAGEVNIIYLSDGAEVAANIIAQKDGVTIGILPEPAVTSALVQDKSGEVRVALDMSAEWDKISDTPIIQGVIVMSNTFLKDHADAAWKFVEEYKASTDFANNNIEEASVLIEKYGIVPKAAIAKRALPNCNIVCYTGEECKNMMKAMLEVLFEANPASIGGKLPDENFYDYPYTLPLYADSPIGNE